jgi:hypothetical protein
VVWLYKGKPLETPSESLEGFVYKIWYSNGDYYIGKKSFWSVRRLRVAGRSKRRVLRKESDWRSYRGSSVEAKKRKDIEKLEVLHVCRSKICTLYYEAYEQMVHNVLCDSKSLNGNILLKLFKCPEKDKVK